MTRERLARLRREMFRCARKRELGWRPANSVAVPQAFSRRRLAASFALRLVRTALELTRFGVAQAGRPGSAAAQEGEKLVRPMTKRRNDGRGFLAARGWRRESGGRRRQGRGRLGRKGG